MQNDEFAAELAREGFGTTLTVAREPGGMLAEHIHPFEAKALILRGEICLTVAGAERRYVAGQVFHLRAGEPHTEVYGPEGVEYLVGRK